MLRSLVAALGFISVLATLVIVGVLMVNSLGGSLGGGSSGDMPSEGATNSVLLRISGTPGLQFSGNYTTPQGTQNVSGTLGTTPTDYKLGGGGVAGLSLVTANVQKQGMYGTLKVEILKNGQVVQSGETDATNNTVSVAYSP
jgi:hypothetical protein